VEHWKSRESGRVITLGVQSEAVRRRGLSRRQALAGLGLLLAGGASAQRASAQVASGGVAGPYPDARLEGGLISLQLAGQRIIGSYPGLTPPASLLADISHGQLAGVIFFSDNIASDTQIAGVIGQLRQAQAQRPVQVPLLLMTDQEGGQVRRLPGQPALSEKQIGQSANATAAATAAGTAAGQNLASVGMNVNLGPVLDVYYQAGNSIDEYQRSYSSDPATVATLGRAFITAQQKTGVAATAKHFPGLGAGRSTRHWTPSARQACRPPLSSKSCAAGIASPASPSPTPWRRAR
jgi:beta-N-acetylhexosaminidase